MARLLIAFVLCILLALGCWVLMPYFGVYMPPIVPLMGFGVIAAGTVLGAWEQGKPGPPTADGNVDGDANED